MSSALSLLGWTFLPNIVTGWVQSIYYGIAIRAGEPRPRPGTPRFAEHRRRIQILVVSLYLLYTIYEADYELSRAGTYYGDLGVSPDASERDIKSRFRRLAALYHPDKAASGAADQAQVNAYFVHLKLASDTLVDPARRFAYERFGPAAAVWPHCKTVRDFVSRGSELLIPYYGLAAAALYGVGLLGYLDWGRFERWLTLAAMFAFELHTITRPGRPALFEKVVNPLLGFFAPGRAPYLPFQVVALMRKLSITVYIAISQLGPLLAADTSKGQIVPASRQGDGEEALRRALDRLEGAARGLDVDSTRLIDMEMAPFAGDESVVRGMRSKLKEWLVQNTIRSDPMVRDALGRSLKKRRPGAAAEAMGSTE